MGSESPLTASCDLFQKDRLSKHSHMSGTEEIAKLDFSLWGMRTELSRLEMHGEDLGTGDPRKPPAHPLSPQLSKRKIVKFCFSVQKSRTISCGRCHLGPCPTVLPCWPDLEAASKQPVLHICSQESNAGLWKFDYNAVPVCSRSKLSLGSHWVAALDRCLTGMDKYHTTPHPISWRWSSSLRVRH